MEILKDGLFLLIMGMTTVFAFLIILMYATQLSSKLINIINKYFPEEIKEDKKPQIKDNFAEIAIAIACAAKRRS